jgi:hypothetical protein
MDGYMPSLSNQEESMKVHSSSSEVDGWIDASLLGLIT